MQKYLAKAAVSANYGLEHFCPLCENSVKTFDKNDTQNCLLCNCSNLERAALLLIMAHYEINKELRILLIDCTGSLSILINKLKESGHLVSVFAFCSIDDKEGNSYNQMLNLNYPKDSFDVILAPFFLERVYNEAHFCRELQRVLIDDGLLLTAFDLDLNRQKTMEFKAFEKGARLIELGNQNYFRRYGQDFQQRLAENKFFVQNTVVKTETLQLCQAFSPLQIIREDAGLGNKCPAMERYLSEKMSENIHNRKGVDSLHAAVYKTYQGWQFFTKKMVNILLLKNPVLNAVMTPFYSVMLILTGWLLFCLIPFLGLPLVIIFMLAGVTVILSMLTNENITPLKKSIMSLLTILFLAISVFPAITFYQYTMGYMISAGVHNLNGVKPDTPQKEAEEQSRMFGK